MRRPHRLPRRAYQVPGQPVAFTIRVEPGLVLTHREPAGLLLQAMRYNARTHGCQMMAYCIMPDHLHLLARVGPHGGDLLDFVDGFKRRTATTLARFARGSAVWQEGYWDRHVRSNEPVANIIHYILMNPVRAELCSHWDEWGYSWQMY
jgi:REP element-mobilizing transposase RayT